MTFSSFREGKPMTVVAELAEQIARLDPAGREQLATLLQDNAARATAPEIAERLATPSIVHSAGVCGGVARIIRTRIPVWTLQRMRQLGVSEADILRSFPALRAIDLVQAWAYADAHPAEIEDQIQENEQD
jgi:uncharacterized protein (DUF433 family)